MNYCLHCSFNGEEKGKGSIEGNQTTIEEKKERLSLA